MTTQRKRADALTPGDVIRLASDSLLVLETSLTVGRGGRRTTIRARSDSEAGAIVERSYLDSTEFNVDLEKQPAR